MKFLVAVVVLSGFSIAEWFRRRKNMRDVLADEQSPPCCIIDTTGASAFFDASRWLALEAEQNDKEDTSRVEAFHGEDGFHEREQALQTRIADWIGSFDSLGEDDSEDMARLGITRAHVLRIGQDLREPARAFPRGTRKLAELVKQLTAPESHHSGHPVR
ncbi:MAG: hypothetical protein KUG77_28770 [Nannocystaceae bacterium]|nr:hypothetical protein [Nannocystaceae bacterium]